MEMEDISLVFLMIGACSHLLCFIFVLIQMFIENPFKAFLGFICGLYAFFWGWTNTERHSLMSVVMIIWTLGLGCFMIGEAISRYG